MWLVWQRDPSQIARPAPKVVLRHRHRAWEQRRAAASGRSAIELIERVIEVERPVEVVRSVEVEVMPKGARWAAALNDFARQLDNGARV